MRKGRRGKTTYVHARPFKAGGFGEVTMVRYQHFDDDTFYYHNFGAGVMIEALEDGSLRIYKPGSTVWVDL